MDLLFEVAIWTELSEVQDQPKKEYSTKYWTSNAFSMNFLYGLDDNTSMGLHIGDEEKETTKVIHLNLSALSPASHPQKRERERASSIN